MNIKNATQYFCIIALGLSIPISTAATSISLALSLAWVLFTNGWKIKWQILKEQFFVWICWGIFLLFLLGTLYSAGSWHDRLTEVKHAQIFLFIPLLILLFTSEKSRMVGLGVLGLSLLIQLIGGTLRYVIWGGPVTLSHDHISIGLMMAWFAFAALQQGVVVAQEGLKIKWLFFIIALLTSVYVVFINDGRTALVVFFALVFYTSLQHWKWRAIFFGPVLIAVIAALAFYHSSHFRVGTQQAVSDTLQYHRQGPAASIENPNRAALQTSGGLRLLWLHYAATIWQAHPIFGVGTGGFHDTLILLFPKDDPSFFIDNPNNDFFTLATQFGLLGVLAFFTLYAGHGYLARKLPEPYRHFLIYLLVSMLVGGLFNSLLRDATESHFYLFVMALCLSANLTERHTRLPGE